jgi:hypothetical protein
VKVIEKTSEHRENSHLEMETSSPKKENEKKKRDRIREMMIMR